MSKKRKEDPAQWSPPSDLPDKECTLPQFWSRHHTEIAKCCKFRKPESTIPSYTATLKVIAENAGTKPIADWLPYEIWDLVVSVPYCIHGEKKHIYSTSTIKARLAIIHDMYIFAESRAICPDILKHPPWKFLDDRNLDFALTSAVMQRQILEILKNRKILPRHLLLPQEQKLAREALAHINEDGRWAGIAILLYSGPRVSVARGVAFKDFIPFTDHPERRYIRYFHSTESNGDFKNKMKNRFSPRDSPEHIELQHIMAIREDFVRSSSGMDDIRELPAVCFKNDFTRVCTSAEFSAFAKEQIVRLFGPEYWDTFRMLQYIDPEDFGKEDDAPTAQNALHEDAELSARLMRRNEFTKNYAESRLDEDNSRLCMGHKPMRASNDPYSEQNLWDRLLAMDHRMILPEIHPGWYTEVAENMPKKSIPDAGIHYIYIPREVVSQGTYCLELDLDLNASGDDFILELYRQLPEGCEIQMDVDYKDPSPHVHTTRLNPDYSHWPLDWNTAVKQLPKKPPTLKDTDQSTAEELEAEESIDTKDV